MQFRVHSTQANSSWTRAACSPLSKYWVSDSPLSDSMFSLLRRTATSWSRPSLTDTASCFTWSRSRRTSPGNRSSCPRISLDLAGDVFDPLRIRDGFGFANLADQIPSVRDPVL